MYLVLPLLLGILIVVGLIVGFLFWLGYEEADIRTNREDEAPVLGETNQPSEHLQSLSSMH